ncbi:hypothetical protein DH2020_028783 [Rehmannia glutinosa]|uniref:DUF4378 domain-containing protein n=1 Tax=Rehmannia glutinosa TaxID=99300 RepID=A0ABR0VS65_REHGL
MERRSARISKLRQKHELSCMWGLFSIIESCQGRTSRKLISNGRPLNKHIIDYPRKLDQLASFDEECRRIQNEADLASATIDASAKSVGTFIREEMPFEKHKTKQNTVEGQQHGKIDSEIVDLLVKTHKRAKENSQNAYQSSSSRRFKNAANLIHQLPSTSAEISLNELTLAAILGAVYAQNHQEESIQMDKGEMHGNTFATQKGKTNKNLLQKSPKTSFVARPSDRIVILKPAPQNVKHSENVTCHCSYLQSHQNSSKEAPFCKIQKSKWCRDSDERKTLKTLGRILSSPEHDFWPVSPRRDSQHSSDSAQMRFSPYNTLHRVTESSSKISNGRERACRSPLRPNTEVTSSCDDADISATHDMKSNGEPKIVEMDRILRPQIHTSEVPSEINSIGNSFSENEALSSTVDEFPSTPLSIDQLDAADSIKNQEEHRSPVSVLEPFYTEDANSPPSVTCQTDGQQLKPLRLVFEECIQEQDHLSQYVHSVLQASCLNWDQLSRIKFPPEELLDASLYDEVEFLLTDCYFDPKLLFDRINEVLLELYQSHFCSPPWPAYVKPKIRSSPLGELVLDEIMTGADFYLLPRTEKRTLDQLVSKDVADCRSWLDVRFDTERIVTEISEDFMEESILDILVILLEFHV